MRAVIAEILRWLLSRGFGVRIVETSFVGVLNRELVISPRGAASRFIASMADVAFSTSEPSPEGMRSSFLRFTVCLARGFAVNVAVAVGLIVQVYL